MSAPQRSDFPNGRTGAIQYQRAVRKHKEFGTPESVGQKTQHKGAINDRGINIGDLYQQTRGGQVEYKNVGGVKTTNIGGEDVTSFNRSAVTLGGKKFYPLQQGADVIYRQSADDPSPVRPAQPPTPDQETELSTETTAIVADETRLNRNGMVQKGRNMSSLNRGDDNMPYIQGERGLLDRVGLGADAKLNSGWASNQLPGTDTALYGGKPVTRGFNSDGMGINTGAERQSLSKNLYADGGAVTFEDGQKQSVSGLSEKASIGVEAADGRPSIFKDARSRAFLDAPNSMAGMRAVDAQLGRVRAGGDYHYTNPNKGQEGEPEFIKVSTETGRAHQNGQMTGQEILSKHMDRVKGNTPDISTTEGEFTQPVTDTPMTSTNPADFPETSAFSPSESGGKFAYNDEAEKFSDPSYGY